MSKKISYCIQLFAGWIILVTSAHASLTAVRNDEISRLSMCPEKPSVLIIENQHAAQLRSALLQHARFSKEVQLVDRPFLGNTHAACHTTLAKQSIIPVDETFAMYIAELNQEGQRLHLQVMRTDNGMIVFDRAGIMGTPMFLQSEITKLVNLLGKQRYECLNKFTATIAENVQLQCAGSLPSTEDYALQSQFHLLFTINSFDLSERASPQSVTGIMRMQPDFAKARIRVRLQQNHKDCEFSMLSQQTRQIELKTRQLPAIFHVTVPMNLNEPWFVEPKIISGEPFFAGYIMQMNEIETHGSNQCKNKNGKSREFLQLKYSEHNRFKFAPQQLNPVCDAESFIQPVFTRTPNLGFDPRVNITTSCTHSTLSAKMSFKRRFYRYKRMMR